MLNIKGQIWLAELIAIGASALLGMVVSLRHDSPGDQPARESAVASAPERREPSTQLAYRARLETTFQSYPQKQTTPGSPEIVYQEAVYDGAGRFRLRTGASPGTLNRSDLVRENGEERYFSRDTMVLRIVRLETPLPWWAPQHAPRETLQDQLEDLFVMPFHQPQYDQQLLEEQATRGLLQPIGTR